MLINCIKTFSFSVSWFSQNIIKLTCVIKYKTPAFCFRKRVIKNKPHVNLIHLRKLGTSLVVERLRTRLLMQGTRVRALVREDPTCHRATKLVCHNYWACALEPVSHNYWAHMPQLQKPAHPEPRLRNKDKSPQWEAHTPQWRVAPACRN